MNSKMNLVCGTCNLQFFIKDLTLTGSRCPMLLNCGHSMCESCIQQNLKASNIVNCQLCGSMSAAEQTGECFPLSVYLLGILVALQNSRHGKDKALKAFLKNRYGNFNYEVKEQCDLNSKSGSNANTCEECSMTALWHCENCESNFCEICWSKVHGAARSLMKHCKRTINEVNSVKTGWRKCQEHKTQDLEFYCKGCSVTICSHCVILHHQGEGHCPITLKEKNVEMINNVKTAAEEAEKINKIMKQTLEKLKVTQTSPEIPETTFSDLQSQITSNFSRIHGMLQLEEERLLRKLHENSSRRENHIQDLRLQLENQIESVERLLQQCDYFVGRPDWCDLTDLHKQLKEVQNLPCYLISRNPRDGEARVAFDERMIELLRIYCTMDLPSNESFELRSGSDLPEGYAVEPLNEPDVDEIKFVSKRGPESSVSDVDTLSNCSSRDLAKPDLELLSAKAPKPFMERKSYSVRVSYIKNPGEFYVTLNSQRQRQQAIDKRASQFANCSLSLPEAIGKDQIYLVKYKVDKKWYRARVMEVLPPKKIGEEECVLIYYLDYGNTETVPVSRLRPIPQDIMEPPLAVKCKLFDCVPKNGQWCVESTKTMEKILNDCTATMFVMKVNRNCLEVDLSVIYPDGQIGRDIVSVRDALLFLEFSSFVQGSKIPRSVTAHKYVHQSLPSVGESFDVMITHVNSPSDFYVQKIKQADSYLYKLTVDLQNYYSQNSEKGILYNPTVGMACAATFSVDEKWYRAKIIDIPGKKMVTVFYVDYGNKETLPWTGIRKLKECFIKQAPMALHCALACILPVHNTWSLQAKSYLENLTLMRNCRVQVHGKPKYKLKLKVLLYKHTNKKEVCVNNAFTDLGFAVKPNPSRLWRAKNQDEEDLVAEILPTLNTPHQRKSDIEEEEEEEEEEDEEKETFTRSKNFRDKPRNKLSAKKLRELHESAKKDCNEASTEASTDETEVEKDDYSNIFKVKVEILSVESPSGIYVTFPALMEEFKHLQTKLNEFYQYSSPVKLDWTVGSVCAVLDSTTSSWYRATILNILPEDRVEVFLKDVAKALVKPLSDIRKLDSSFAKFATCAVKCHLADIRPPGEEWPTISSEYLETELEKFNEVYMTKRGQIDNKSLPVELWVQKIVLRGALEPSTKEWVTLNRLLVSEGLAVPSKQKMYSGVTSNEGECSDESKEPENKKTAREEVSQINTAVKEETVESDFFVPPPGSRWLPPKPIGKSRFLGQPTYVDFNGCIHMYDVEEDEQNLKMIREVLLKQYDDSKPDSEDHFLSAGEMCIARYHGDNLWYRGQILHNNLDFSYNVLFVDYGNVETCEAADLRGRIKMHDIPIISHKFRLQGISPASVNNEWPLAVIDILHALVVDKQCQVNVLKAPADPSEPYTISLRIIEGDVDVSAFLIDKGLASLTCSMSDVSDVLKTPVNIPLNGDFPLLSQEVDWDANVPPRFAPLDVPDICNGFPIRVTSIISETDFFANIADDELLPSNLRKAVNEFESLKKKLAEECHLQPLLENFTQGQPCCCVRFRNNGWCRAQIEGFTKLDNSICVFYVDDGDKEIVCKDLVHKLKSEWIKIPKMAVKFRLGNVEKTPNVSKSVYLKTLTGCLSQDLLFAEVSNKYGDVLEVKLFSKRNGPLAYQEMIDKNLMTLNI